MFDPHPDCIIKDIEMTVFEQLDNIGITLLRNTVALCIARSFVT